MDSNLSELSKTDDMFKLFCWILNKSDSPFSVEIGKSKTVDHLKKAIKKEKEPELDHLAAPSLDIWKLSSPIHSSEVSEQLRHAQSPQDIAGCVELDPLDELSEHFSSPPYRHVHIVVQLPPPSRQFGRPRTPSRTRGNYIEFLRSRHVKDEAIRESVDTCLRYARPCVRAFLKESDLCQSWTPPCDDPRVLDHLTKLRIPSIGGGPCLSLHDLGGTVVETAVVDDVFHNQSDMEVHLINTSGSGKTRILFEGLLKHWGLYFTCSREQVLGSEDMSHVLTNLSNPLPSDADLRQALEHDMPIAWRRFRQVLIARLLILQLFLEEAREICPEGPLDRYRGHWLMLQLRPGER
ncbi:hypothetical protein L208DRAFT_121499 [Tricholoma matsutake]|nr:hypothetical protein L208DRAFT_121499 [Tricholoma matsutake 945]